MDYTLLKRLCDIHAPSGEEGLMKAFLLDYVDDHKDQWKVQPTVLAGPELQDCVVLVFGQPKTAVYAHIDSIGFTVRYENQLVPIGGPEAKTGYVLKGHDSLGPITCKMEVNEEQQVLYQFGRGIDTGTSLTFESNFREDEDFVQSCYLDNRLGVFSCLKLAETLEDGMLIFSCWEEHGGGTVPFLAKLMVEEYHVKQALIADITWVTEGVKHGEGVAISMRDRNVPRQSYIQKIIELAKKSNIPFQLEVEGGGSSDGRELQQSPYPIDWCFVGAPEDHVHSPDEKVHKKDIEAMLVMYQMLMAKL